MKIPVIKQLVEKHSLKDLEETEACIWEERAHSMPHAGDDTGDQLTNVMAAIWIKREMEEKGVDLKTGIRTYSQRVRDSIS